MRKIFLFFMLLPLSLSAQMVIQPGRGSAANASSSLGLPEQWLMHDGSGQAFVDATANDNTITTSNITWGTGTGVTSPTFNGVNSTGVSTQVPITDFDGTKAFSVSLWINPDTGADPALVSTLNPASNFTGWELGLSGGGALTNGIEFFLVNTYPSNAIQVAIGSTIAVGVIFNLIVTYDGSQTAAGISGYINGVLQSDITVTADSLSASSASGLPLHVGSRADGSVPYNGSMSNLQIFSGVLTSGQITAIQTAGP
jgi:hypothetical protein